MKPNKHKLKYKKAKKMLKELNKICQAPVVSEKLDEPIQKGYKRYLVLSPEALNSSHKATLQRILEKISVTSYSMNSKFLERQNKGMRLAVKPILFHHLSITDYRALVHPDLHRMFVGCDGGKTCPDHVLHSILGTVGPSVNYHWWQVGPDRAAHYHIREEWANKMYQPKIVKNLLTHVKLIDGDLESKKKWLETKLFDQQLSSVLGNKRTSWDQVYTKRMNKKDRIRNKEEAVKGLTERND